MVFHSYLTIICKIFLGKISWLFVIIREQRSLLFQNKGLDSWVRSKRLSLMCEIDVYSVIPIWYVTPYFRDWWSCTVTEIVLKSQFLSVNRSPIQYGFCGSTEAIWYTVNTAEVCRVILQTHSACSTVGSFSLRCHHTKSIIHANRIYHLLALSSALPLFPKVHTEIDKCTSMA